MKFTLPQQPAVEVGKSSEPPGIAHSVHIVDWRGMVSNANPHRLGNLYVQYQQNMCSIVLGQVYCRAGLRAVTFEN